MDANSHDTEQQLIQEMSQCLFQIAELLSVLREKVLQKADLSKGDFKVLLCLKSRDGITMKDLTILAKLSRLKVGQIVERLEDRKYIVRTKDQDDRRQVSIVLTFKGKQVLHQFEEILQQVSAYAWKQIGDTDSYSLFVEQIRILSQMPLPGVSKKKPTAPERP